MIKHQCERDISKEIAERNDLLHKLANELQLFGEMTNQSMETEIKLIHDQSDFWEACRFVENTINQIEDQIKKLIESQESDTTNYDEQYTELQNQHSILEIDLQNAKSMSRSIATKASIIRNKRISPILNLLWSMTSKSFNAQMISKYNAIFDVLFQFIEKAENADSNLATLGILVNISSSSQGRQSLINALHKSPVPCIKKLLNSYELLSDQRVCQLILYLIKNITMCDEIRIELIREGCIKFCSEYLEQIDIHSMKKENDFQIVIDVLDTILSMKYIKTLNFYSQKDLNKLYLFLKTYEPDLKILAKIKSITNIEDKEQHTLKPKRFGVKRIYS